MKTLHLVSAMYSSKGHSKEYIKNFSEFLSKSYSINLFVASEPSALISSLHFSVTYLPVDYRKTDAENFTNFGRGANYLRAISKQYLSYKYYRAIIKSSAVKAGDLVFIMDYDVLPLYFMVKNIRNAGARVFLMIHSAQFDSADIFYSAYKRFFKFVFNRFIGSRIEKIIVNGDYIRDRLKVNLNLNDSSISVVQYPSKITVERIDKQTARKELGFNNDENIVLFFGLLRKDKNIRTLIESIALCKSPIKLIIAGAEASVTKGDIENWLQEFNVKNFSLDIAYHNDAKMALYYSCADLLLLTYTAGNVSQSGPLSLAREFLLPTVATDSGEIGYYIKSNRVGFVSDSSPLAYATEVDRFFTLDKTAISVIKDNIISAREKFSWESAAAKYRMIFDEK